MKLGVNWTSPRHTAVARALLGRGACFCEVMIDNFLHLPPHALAAAFPGVPLAFHVMNSRFLRRDREELEALAARLKLFARELRPLYVSDHLAVFSEGARSLPFPQELDYAGEGALALERVKLWQDLLGLPLLLENYPSILDQGRAQPEFFARLALETGAGLLLDLSNAVVAQLNCGAPASGWLALARGAVRFHAAGYRAAGTQPEIIQDSHDGELSQETLAFLRQVAPLTRGRDCTMVVERDANIEEESWARDLAAAAEAFA